MTIDEFIASRPTSLTEERARSFLPILKTNPEWERKHDAGELPDGLVGMRGMLIEVWPDDKPTADEARWMLGLTEYGSWRWMASIVLHGDCNQINAVHLLEASRAALEAG